MIFIIMKEQKKFTCWDHFEKNYMWTTIIFIGLFLTTMIMEIMRGSDEWWYSFFFLIIGVVVIPIGNYLSWKKKFGDK